MKEFASKYQILSSEMMQAADKNAINSGIKGISLMESAGRAVAAEILKKYKKCNVLVVCGPGNNGGDGFVIAGLLKKKGWKVELCLYRNEEALKGDAATMAKKFKAAKGVIKPLDEKEIKGRGLVVDALFGTGLLKPITGEVKKFIEALNGSGAPVIAVDIPSGVNGSTGGVMGVAVKADVTVTFVWKKLGHLLIPGKEFAGELVVKDIGIEKKHMPRIKENFYENSPELWIKEFPFPKTSSHKYKRGAAVVFGGEKPGAAKIAALSALRSGVGLVTIAHKKETRNFYAAELLAVMAERISDASSFMEFIKDERRNTILIGPGAGVNGFTQALVLQALELNKNVVLDADAITSFSDRFTNDSDKLFTAIKKCKGQVVMTPHEGEFQKLFRDITGKSKVEKALNAARISGAVVVFKGADTVVAEPDGVAIINANAPPYLATAGSGDALAGIIMALIAQGMEAFLAASAAVWIHGEVAVQLGIGMISEDMPAKIPDVLKMLEKKNAILADKN